eukprot:5565056-Pyramimonas_sp.AAC.1
MVRRNRRRKLICGRRTTNMINNGYGAAEGGDGDDVAAAVHGNDAGSDLGDADADVDAYVA